jgi:hypothetical protein
LAIYQHRCHPCASNKTKESRRENISPLKEETFEQTHEKLSMASATVNPSSIPLLAGKSVDELLINNENNGQSNFFLSLVRGPGAVQLVTSPTDKADVEKVNVFDTENCRLTCFSRTGHQFVVGNKDGFVLNYSQ